jgi:hypothetical protein
MQHPCNRLRTSFKTIGLILAAYVAAYALNSALGGYWGPTWAPPTEGIPDRSKTAGFRWQPRFGYYDRYRPSDFFGYLFAPLIGVDQRWIHCTHFMTDADYDSWIIQRFRLEVHPTQRHFFTTTNE